jgi:hypothetical protein
LDSIPQLWHQALESGRGFADVVQCDQEGQRSIDRRLLNATHSDEQSCQATVLGRLQQRACDHAGVDHVR